MNSKQRAIDTFVPPVVTGMAAALGSVMVHGTGVIPMFGHNIPSTVAFGATAAAASFIGGVLFNYAAPHIPHNLRNAEAEKLMVKPVLTGAACFGLLKATAESDVDFAPNFGIGAVSELIGQQTGNAAKSFVSRHL